MSTERLPERGQATWAATLAHPLLIAVVGIVLWSITGVASRAVLLASDIEAVALSLVQLIVGGTVTFLALGSHRIEFRAFRLPLTWVIGVARVVSAVAFTAALGMAAAATVALISLMNVALSVAAGAALLGRTPNRRELFGFLLILLPAVVAAVALPGGLAHPVIATLIVGETAAVLGGVAAERHPMNSGASMLDRARLTAAVLLLTALGFLVAGALVSTLGGSAGLGLPDIVPSLDRLGDPTLWIAGAVIGALGRAPATFFGLSGIRRFGADGWLIVLVVLPLGFLAVESLAAIVGFMPPPEAAGRDLALSLVAVCGACLVLRSRRDALRRAPSFQQTVGTPAAGPS